MGNFWDSCCQSETPEDLDNSAKQQLLLTSALRTRSQLPPLGTKTELRRESKRTVRIESLSPMIEVDDEYDSNSEDSETGYPMHESPLTPAPKPITPKVSPSRLSARNSPKQQNQQMSGLRLLLASAGHLNEEPGMEQKSDLEGKHDIGRGLRRVGRQDSLQSVLKTDENDIKFASAPVAAMRGSDLPRGLVFAFLDDSVVSRTAFKNTLKTSLYGSEDSIIRGSTIDEARAFSIEVASRKPDIVVLDHCLDFEVSPGVYQTLKGTDIAKDIRQKGYDGCIIMQSEHDSLKDEVDFEIVDGVTGKGKGTHAFAIARMVALARRKNKLQTHFPMPSSTHSSWNSRAESSFSFDVEDGTLSKRESHED